MARSDLDCSGQFCWSLRKRLVDARCTHSSAVFSLFSCADARCHVTDWTRATDNQIGIFSLSGCSFMRSLRDVGKATTVRNARRAGLAPLFSGSPAKNCLYCVATLIAVCSEASALF